MQDLPILINITVALVVAFIGGILARKIGFPSIVGYLLAGIAIGPFTPGFEGDVDTIHQLAELGVIFLMFGVGLHFSFKDLWKVRDVAIPGAVLQTLLATLLGYGLSQLWGWSHMSGLILGLSISVASTVVLLRGLMDHNLLNTPHGQSAVGWLVMEDILSVLILVLMPALVNTGGGFDWGSLALTLLKAAAFVVIMVFAGAKLIPWLLNQIAHTRSRELFILAILAIALGTALAAANIFGVSLALGAFVAGAIISQSHLSHQVGADILPFREAFSVLFFVSVGMLVNPVFLWDNIGKVLVLTGLIVIGKAIIVLALSTISRRPARTFLVVAIGLSQIGEFSFIIGQAGLSLNLFTSDQYSLILAGALLSITFNPVMYMLMPKVEKLLQRLPGLWKRMDSHVERPLLEDAHMQDHVVIIGYGRIGKHLVEVLNNLNVPLLVIESNVDRIDELNQKDTATLFGDAANSEVITHACLECARAVVITVPEDTTAAMIVTAARHLNPKVPIIVRAESVDSIDHLSQLGANFIIQPELEGGLELIQYTLLHLGFPLRQVHEYAEAVRRDHYDIVINSHDEHRSLHDLLVAFNGIEISWISLEPGSPLIGQTLVEANVRSRTGASIVAIIRDQRLIANPKSLTELQPGDRVGVIGETNQIQAAKILMDGVDYQDPKPALAG